MYTAHCRLTVEETLSEHSVVYGGSCERRRAADRPAPQTLQIDFLSKVLDTVDTRHCAAGCTPNYIG